MRARFGLAAIGALALIAGCAKPSSEPAPLARVQPLPAPSVPAWIAQIAPLGAAKNRSQIRVIFASPVLPVQQLGSSAESSVLSHFRIDPDIGGGFIVLTPRMIGFQSDAQLPPATRIRVTLTAGLKDLQGHALDRDLAWTFTTTPLQIQLPDGFQTPRAAVGLRPDVPVQANTEIDPAELANHARFQLAGSSQTVPVSVSPQPQPSFEPYFTYDLSPASDLQKAASYQLVVDSGVMPKRGNLPSKGSLTLDLQTYSPLAFAREQPASDPSQGNSRFKAGDPAFVFNNALDPKTFDRHVHVSPAPANVGQLYSLSDDGTQVYLNPYALSPRTQYAVTFDAGLTDVLGQSLSRAVAVPYSTGDVAPAFWAPSGSNTFVAGENLQLQYAATNVPGNRYRAAYRTLSALDVANLGSRSAWDLLPDAKSWKQFAISGATPNVESNVEVPLAQRFASRTGMLAYGATAAVPNAQPIYGSVQLTNLGILAQWFPAGGSVLVQHLSDGSPAAGAHVDVYVPRGFDNPAPARLCASGTAGAGGSFAVSGAALQSCYAQNLPASQGPSLMAVASEGPDWAYVDSYDWSGIYQYSSQYLDATWSAGQPISRGIVYSDRQMYQPGERGWFTAVCYVLQNGELRAERDAPYSVVLRDPNGVESKLPAQKANGYATFSFPITFGKTQALGYYTIVATGPDGAQISGSFRVAEFRPPNFSVDLKLDRQFAAAGDSVQAAGDGKYLFGAPMSGASATVHVTRQQAALAPKGWDDYAFGPQWYWPDTQPDVNSEVSSQTLTLDASGKGSAHVAVDRSLPFAMTYQIDFEVTDASHLASSATQTFTALPSETLIGLDSDFVGTVNAPIAVSVIAVDPSGAVRPGSAIHVQLQKMEYSGVTQIVEGAEAARNQVRYTTVAQADVTSANAPVSVKLQAGDPGSYRIRANFAGASTQSTATDTQVWISGPGQAVWGQQSPSQLQMKLDKANYRAGDVAQVSVASPYQDADLYLSVIRDRVLYSTLVHVRGSAPVVRVPISQQMFPNAAVQGVLVRRGAPISRANVQGIDSLVRIGVMPFAVDLAPQYLKVTASAAKARLLPGGRESVQIHVRDSAGKPVRAQLTVAVANDAILQLSGYRFPDLVKTVFDTQPISTRFADNRPDLTLAQPANVSEKGWGYGGGFLAGAAGTRVRTKFLPLAYFDGAVTTDASGNANVSFDVPDNLTTWRVMVLAATAEDRPRFGDADTTFITTKPLVTDPLLPQFARPGDRFDAGLLLMNAASRTVDARTEALLDGSLTFASPADSRKTQAEQSFGAGLNAWRFPMVAGSPGPAELTVRTLVVGGASDAFRVPFDVRETDVTETTLDSGSTRETAQISTNAGAGGNSIRIDIAGSLLPQVVAPAQRALESENLPLLDTAAGRLSIAGSILTLQRELGARIGRFDARAAANAAILQLQRLQRVDGGFAFWPGEGATDALGTADAYRALAEARSNGVAVPAAMISKAKPYVVRTLADPAGVAKWCTTGVCKATLRLQALAALAAGGDRRTDFLQGIYQKRASLDVATRAQLALYVQQTPGWQPQARALAAEFENDVYETGRYSNLQPANPWSGSDVEAQAAYLQFMIARGSSSDRVDRALQALVAQACRCGWGSDGDTAAALTAIAAYGSQASPQPNFKVDVEMDGKSVGTATFSSQATPMKTFELRNVSPGAHQITLRKAGSGTLRYAVAYSYSLDARAPGRLAGLRVIRQVRAANSDAVIASMDIVPAQAPLSLPAGNVYDVALEIVTDHPVDRVTIADPLPAGLEALDTSFLTTASYYQPLADTWEIGYQQIYSDRVEAFAEHLDPGVYTLHYLARTVTPGEYLWPGATAYLRNAPEQFGRSAFQTLDVVQ